MSDTDFRFSDVRFSDSQILRFSDSQISDVRFGFQMSDVRFGFQIRILRCQISDSQIPGGVECRVPVLVTAWFSFLNGILEAVSERNQNLQNGRK